VGSADVSGSSMSPGGEGTNWWHTRRVHMSRSDPPVNPVFSKGIGMLTVVDRGETQFFTVNQYSQNPWSS